MRKKREWYPGAQYHIMSRGNYRQEIVKDDMDRQFFLNTLMVAINRYNCMLHAFCLMDNHYHLLLETKEEPVWKPMKYLGLNYSIYFNKKYDKIGHLFQSRYKSCLVETDNYFLETSRYIHLNPVKARLVLKPEIYRWSSYRTYLGIKKLSFIETNRGLGYFKNDSIRKYREYTESKSMVKTMDQIRKDIGENELWLPW